MKPKSKPLEPGLARSKSRTSGMDISETLWECAVLADGFRPWGRGGGLVVGCLGEKAKAGS
jgi:hypothetical protein